MRGWEGRGREEGGREGEGGNHQPSHFSLCSMPGRITAIPAYRWPSQDDEPVSYSTSAFVRMLRGDGHKRGLSTHFQRSKLIMLRLPLRAGT